MTGKTMLYFIKNYEREPGRLFSKLPKLSNDRFFKINLNNKNMYSTCVPRGFFTDLKAKDNEIMRMNMNCIASFENFKDDFMRLPKNKIGLCKRSDNCIVLYISGYTIKATSLHDTLLKNCFTKKFIKDLDTNKLYIYSCVPVIRKKKKRRLTITVSLRR